MNTYHFNHLSNYTTFNSIEELNHHVNQFRNKTTKTEFKVLWFISKYAVKFIGAAHLKLQTIADGIEMSVKTVQRAIKSLTDLQAIKKVNTTRTIKGGTGANIYQILPSYDDNVQAQMSKRENVESTHNDNVCDEKSENQTAYSFKQKSIKDINTYSKPYSSFIDTVGIFVKDKKLTSKMYGIYLAHIKHLKSAYSQESLLDVALNAIKTTFIATKRKNIKSLTGYFNNTLDKMLDKLYTESVDLGDDLGESVEFNHSVLYNWLEN